MSDSKKRRSPANRKRRPKRQARSGRRTVTLGGTSQSTFAQTSMQGVSRQEASRRDDTRQKSEAEEKTVDDESPATAAVQRVRRSKDDAGETPGS